ncbi:MAG: acyltransferase [Terracidiphilus sp.]
MDILRAVAVLCVYFAHLLQVHGAPICISLGLFGVIIFFIHTSFVLMASLQRLQGSGASKTSLTTAFYLRRIFRIYPLAILCVVVMVAFHIPAQPYETYTWIGMKGFLSNLALIQNLTNSPDIQHPLWSLPLELEMYLFLPFIYFAIRAEKFFRSIALWMLMLPLALASTLLMHVTPGGLVAQIIRFELIAPCFISGVVAFDLSRNRTWTWKLPAWVWPIGIFAAIFLFGPLDDASLANKFARAWVLSLLLGLLYANLRETRPNWTHSFFHWIAEHSYSIYLTHSIVFWFVFYPMAQLSLWLRIPALIVGSIGIPALLYRTIERPMIQTGARLAARLLVAPDKRITQ